MNPFRILYLDMNSFFASVEQQLNPALRGRPVAITAVDSESGACVAASYEAKAFGVKTGTSVRDARRLCPGITFLPSRHRLYVRFNLAVADVLDRHAELTHIRSVDEFQLALSGEARSLAGAVDLVARLKAAVAAEVGIGRVQKVLPSAAGKSAGNQWGLFPMRRRACLSCHKGLPLMGRSPSSGPCLDPVGHVVALFLASASGEAIAAFHFG